MKKAKLIREKKTRKAETTHLRNIIHHDDVSVRVHIIQLPDRVSINVLNPEISLVVICSVSMELAFPAFPLSFLYFGNCVYCMFSATVPFFCVSNITRGHMLNQIHRHT